MLSLSPLMMRAKSLKFFQILPWPFLALIAAYLLLAGGWKDVTLGRIQRIGMGTFLPPHVPGGVGVASAKIYLLAGTEEQATKETFSENWRVYGEVTLKTGHRGDASIGLG